MLVVAEDGRGQRVEGDLARVRVRVRVRDRVRVRVRVRVRYTLLLRVLS